MPIPEMKMAPKGHSVICFPDRQLIGRPARQRVSAAFVELPDAIAVETLFLDLEVGAEQRIGGHFLHGKADRLGGGLKTLVANGAPGLATAAGKELRRSLVINITHLTRPPRANMGLK